MHLSKTLLSLAAAATVFGASSASAVSITADFSQLGSVFQDTSGILYSSSAAGRTDVTSLFQLDVNAGISYLQNSILLPWNTTITFTLANLSSDQAVGDSSITAFDANGRASASDIRVDTGNLALFLDPTPQTNSEFSMSTKDATLGGGAVNVSRFGDAVTGGPAADRWDMLTLVVHETEHSLGFSGGSDLFLAAAGATGSANRSILIPKSISGMPGSFSVPFVSGSAHIDGVTQNGLFNDTVVAEPGFDVGQRALPTAVELEALCVVNGCTSASDINTNISVSAVPEPSSWLMMLAGGGLVGAALRRRKSVTA
jgi:hypothetical protein